MPVDTSLYPDNWSSLALTVKESARWRCQCCGKKCYEPGERPEGLSRSQWTADILQVHHAMPTASDFALQSTGRIRVRTMTKAIIGYLI
ncbi:MAG: HNH endonuclease [Cyanobacteria bacterium J06629_2]